MIVSECLLINFVILKEKLVSEIAQDGACRAQAEEEGGQGAPKQAEDREAS